MTGTVLHARLVTSMTRTAPHVLVIGGGYGGMSAISRFVNLCNGGSELPRPFTITEFNSLPTLKPKITLLYGRDGISTLISCSSDGLCVLTIASSHNELAIA
jgi:hypothetical protein